MKEEIAFLQTYEIFLKLIYLKLLQEYWTYEWDSWNRLVKVVQYNAPDNGECVEVSYEYDALNHRISRTTDSETTKYAYGRNGALAYQEKTKDGKIKKRSFAYLNNEIVGFTDKVGEEESVYYTVTDIQGSITEVYDNDSNLVWKSGYTAFGELAGETVDLIDFDGMYTGCDYDSATGLTYHWNRWRSEDGSCFISEDPIRDGTNWYGYAGQNPMVYVDPTGLAPYINGIYDGDYNPDYNPGVPVEGPKTQQQQKYYEPQGPTALPNSLDFRIEPIYNFYGDFVGYGAEGEQRAEAFEKTQFFYFHFEGRNKRNIITETFDEIYNSSQSKNGDWILLDYNMSLLHQNEKGSAELKFICKDGREAVFTKDFSKDGSYELYTDPRYVGTFNYCNPVPAPKGISDVKGLFNFIGKSIIGHGCLDVIPYYVTGKRNVRDSAKIVK